MGGRVILSLATVLGAARAIICDEGYRANTERCLKLEETKSYQYIVRDQNFTVEGVGTVIGDQVAFFEIKGTFLPKTFAKTTLLGYIDGVDGPCSESAITVYEDQLWVFGEETDGKIPIGTANPNSAVMTEAGKLVVDASLGDGGLGLNYQNIAFSGFLYDIASDTVETTHAYFVLTVSEVDSTAVPYLVEYEPWLQGNWGAGDVLFTLTDNADC